MNQPLHLASGIAVFLLAVVNGVLLVTWIISYRNALVGQPQAVAILTFSVAILAVAFSFFGAYLLILSAKKPK
jgi:hypothetical protein